MMTRKDYIKIARAIRVVRDTDSANSEYQSGVNDTAYAIASVLRQDNERFERNKFLEACGVVSTKEGF